MKRRRAAAKSDTTMKNEEPKPKKKRQTKTMNKSTRKTLQASIRAMDTSILSSEVVTAVREQCFDGSLAALAKELGEAKELLREIVEYHRDLFAQLHLDCKKEKNSQIRFKMMWASYCSAFLLEEQYSLNAIDLIEENHPELVRLRQAWLDFCKEHKTPLPASRPVMMALSTAIYNSLIEHVRSFQSSQSDTVETSIASNEVEEDGVYYRFGGGVLCEMLHRRYDQIGSAKNKNLMSIEISILQAVNTKDKSDIPDYLKYQDRGYMYFPHKVFLPFLRQVDTCLKKVVNPASLNEHGSNLIKVAHNEIKGSTVHKTEFLNALSKRLPVTHFDCESETALNNVFEEFTRKLCNTRIQEFLSATKQEFATKKGLASTVDLNLRTTLLSNHTKLSSTV